MLAQATQSVFKAEVLQDYTGVDDGPSLQAWLRGEKAEAMALARELMEPWIEQRRQSKATITRVRITEEPFVPYLEWEIACLYSIYAETETELVYLLPKARLSDLVLPDGDFLIF